MTEPRVVQLHVHLDSTGTVVGDPVGAQTLAVVKEILARLRVVQERGTTMSKELDDLKAAVTRSASVQTSAIELLKGVASQITAAGTDQAALEELATSINDQSDALAKALVANTPGHPTDPNNPDAPIDQQIPDPNNPPLDPNTDAPVIITDPGESGSGVPSDTGTVPLPNTDTTGPAPDVFDTGTTADDTPATGGVNTEA